VQCQPLVRSANDELKVEGDPTEAALTVAARKAGLGEPVLARSTRLDVVPFESSHMYMASLHAGTDGPTLYVKGSSDALLARCVERLEADGSLGLFDEAAVHHAVEAMAARGRRVLLMARRTLPGGTRRAAHDDVAHLTFLGLTNPAVWLGAAGMLGAQLAVTYVPIMNRLFHTAPIDLWWWGVMTLIGAVVFALAEAKKAWSAMSPGRAAMLEP
jgi:magnesium-transporting ATPase (P-type)